MTLITRHSPLFGVLAIRVPVRTRIGRVCFGLYAAIGDALQAFQYSVLA